MQMHLQMAVVTLGTTKQPLPGFTGRVAAPKEHGEMGYNYELAAASPPVSSLKVVICYYLLLYVLPVRVQLPCFTGMWVSAACDTRSA
jgi:hypothetical protein